MSGITLNINVNPHDEAKAKPGEPSPSTITGLDVVTSPKSVAPVTGKEKSKTFTSENYRYVDDPENYAHGRLIMKNMSCDTLRKKINMFLATKEMTQAEFLNKIEVNSNSFRNFMHYSGPDTGINNGTYAGAIIFFAERDKKAKLKQKEEQAAEKKAGKRSAEEAITHTEGASSSGPSTKKSKTETQAELIQAIQKIPLRNSTVYDDCDEIRGKISRFVQTEVPMSKFADAIDATPQTVNKFLSKKGSTAGAGSKVYPNAYIFFEKHRLLLNQPKSPKRIKNEKDHPNGFSLAEPSKYGYVYTY